MKLANPVAPPQDLEGLYERDETAWLELMSRLIEEKRLDQLDYGNLASYLNDMAIRDRRELKSRLIQLMLHLLKWVFQPEQRTRSWLSSIHMQRFEVQQLLESQVLRQQAQDELATYYPKARSWALKVSGLEESALPSEIPFTLDQLLDDDWPKDLTWQPKRRGKK